MMCPSLHHTEQESTTTMTNTNQDNGTEGNKRNEKQKKPSPLLSLPTGKKQKKTMVTTKAEGSTKESEVEEHTNSVETSAVKEKNKSEETLIQTGESEAKGSTKKKEEREKATPSTTLPQKTTKEGEEIFSDRSVDIFSLDSDNEEKEECESLIITDNPEDADFELVNSGDSDEKSGTQGQKPIRKGLDAFLSGEKKFAHLFQKDEMEDPVEELKEMAQKKNLQLNFEEPETFSNGFVARITIGTKHFLSKPKPDKKEAKKNAAKEALS